MNFRLCMLYVWHGNGMRMYEKQTMEVRCHALSANICSCEREVYGPSWPIFVYPFFYDTLLSVTCVHLNNISEYFVVAFEPIDNVHVFESIIHSIRITLNASCAAVTMIMMMIDVQNTHVLCTNRHSYFWNLFNPFVRCVCLFLRCAFAWLWL